VSTFNLERLDNGLRILTAPMDSAQSVTCAIMLAAGSRYETPETNGIAHFAEHMFFKGTERRRPPATSPWRSHGIGGEFNAFTGKEYTGTTSSAPPSPVTSPSTSSSTCCATRSSIRTRSSARKA